MVTKKEYLQALRERRLELRERIMIDNVDNKFVDRDDKRFAERHLINKILRLIEQRKQVD